MTRVNATLRAAAVLGLAVTAFGLRPAVAAPAAPTITVTPQVLTPYHSGGCWQSRYPCYTVKGKADPGADVIVTVTDDLSSHSVAATVHAADQDDPGMRIEAGDWSMSPNVTDLGGHGQTDSVLTFSAVAALGGETSAPAQATVTKSAATPGDVYGPLTRFTRPPPAIVCRDIFVPCAQLDTASQNPIRFTGDYPISGYVDDDHPDAFGLASEVADVIIQVIDAQTGRVWLEFHSFTRRGPQAFFGAVIRGNDFPPLRNFTVTVKAVDALGNVGNEVATSFFVTP